MGNESSYISENNYWTERLRSLVEHISDEDLQHPLEAGWTVSAVLAHLAFWDIRLVTLLDIYNKSGSVADSPVDGDIINEVSRYLCLAIAPRKAAEMALEWAMIANRAIEATPADLAAEVASKTENVRLDRAHHRKVHIEDIEKTLGITSA